MKAARRAQARVWPRRRARSPAERDRPCTGTSSSRRTASKWSGAGLGRVLAENAADSGVQDSSSENRVARLLPTARTRCSVLMGPWPKQMHRVRALHGPQRADPFRWTILNAASARVFGEHTPYPAPGPFAWPSARAWSAGCKAISSCPDDRARSRGHTRAAPDELPFIISATARAPRKCPGQLRNAGRHTWVSHAGSRRPNAIPNWGVQWPLSGWQVGLVRQMAFSSGPCGRHAIA